METMNKNITPGNTVFSGEEIISFRKETDGCANVIHLNNAGAGLMPNIVTQSQLEHIKLESLIGGYEAAALKAETIQQFYVQAAALFNCKPSNIAFTAS